MNRARVFFLYTCNVFLLALLSSVGSPVVVDFFLRHKKVEDARARIDALCDNIFRRRREGQPTEPESGKNERPNRCVCWHINVHFFLCMCVYVWWKRESVIQYVQNCFAFPSSWGLVQSEKHCRTTSCVMSKFSGGALWAAWPACEKEPQPKTEGCATFFNRCEEIFRVYRFL